MAWPFRRQMSQIRAAHGQHSSALLLGDGCWRGVSHGAFIRYTVDYLHRRYVSAMPLGSRVSLYYGYHASTINASPAVEYRRLPGSSHCRRQSLPTRRGYFATDTSRGFGNAFRVIFACRPISSPFKHWRPPRHRIPRSRRVRLLPFYHALIIGGYRRDTRAQLRCDLIIRIKRGKERNIDAAITADFRRCRRQGELYFRLPSRFPDELSQYCPFPGHYRALGERVADISMASAAEATLHSPAPIAGHHSSAGTTGGATSPARGLFHFYEDVMLMMPHFIE